MAAKSSVLCADPQRFFIRSFAIGGGIGASVIINNTSADYALQPHENSIRTSMLSSCSSSACFRMHWPMLPADRSWKPLEHSG